MYLFYLDFNSRLIYLLIYLPRHLSISSAFNLSILSTTYPLHCVANFLQRWAHLMCHVADFLDDVMPEKRGGWVYVQSEEMDWKPPLQENVGRSSPIVVSGPPCTSYVGSSNLHT